MCSHFRRNGTFFSWKCQSKTSRLLCTSALGTEYDVFSSAINLTGSNINSLLQPDDLHLSAIHFWSSFTIPQIPNCPKFGQVSSASFSAPLCLEAEFSPILNLFGWSLGISTTCSTERTVEMDKRAVILCCKKTRLRPIIYWCWSSWVSSMCIHSSSGENFTSSRV